MIKNNNTNKNLFNLFLIIMIILIILFILKLKQQERYEETVRTKYFLNKVKKEKKQKDKKTKYYDTKDDAKTLIEYCNKVGCYFTRKSNAFLDKDYPGNIYCSISSSRKKQTYWQKGATGSCPGYKQGCLNSRPGNWVSKNRYPAVMDCSQYTKDKIFFEYVKQNIVKMYKIGDNGEKCWFNIIDVNGAPEGIKFWSGVAEYYVYWDCDSKNGDEIEIKDVTQSKKYLGNWVKGFKRFEFFMNIAGRKCALQYGWAMDLEKGYNSLKFDCGGYTGPQLLTSSQSAPDAFAIEQSDKIPKDRPKSYWDPSKYNHLTDGVGHWLNSKEQKE